MNATDTIYNPFRAAAAAAFAELSSEQAQRFYSLKAHKDVQTILDTSITLCAWVFQLAELTYMMGAQCRAWCDALEANAQAPARPMLMLAPAQIENTEDPWEVEADYELVEFSPSIAAQAIASPMLMLAPASTVVCGSVRKPAPKDMHTEVEWLTRAAATPANTIDEPATALNVPGATGGKTGAKASICKAKGGAGNARANAKTKPSKGDAEAVAIAPRRGRKSRV